METFMRLYGSLIVFVYHCFDRIVINGYLSMLTRPENVVYFFQQVVGIPLITKEALAQRTHDYQGWVKGFARNHNIRIQWAEKGVKKEEFFEPLELDDSISDRYGEIDQSLSFRNLGKNMKASCLVPEDAGGFGE
jgi:hypothetical protein